MLQQDTLEFLKALKQNNDREWFAQNKAWYERAKIDFEALVTQLIGAIASFDSNIGHLDAKKCIFRIYRDVRFSPDKSPYKGHFGAIIRPSFADKSSGYYFHLDPDEIFLSSGYYMLEPAQLKKMRKGIYDDFEMFSSIINEKHFKKDIGDLYRDEDSTLKRVPNGYDKDSPAAEYLKLKRFYVLKTVSEKEVLNGDFVNYAASVYKQMQPLNEFLNDILLD